MLMKEMTNEECNAVLARLSLARLGCVSEDQPYVVPIHFAHEGDYIYVFSTSGQKIKWMRANPKVCIQADEIQNDSEWVSVIVNGVYEELPEPQYAKERKHASSLLGKRYHWWLNALAEREMKQGESAIEPLFFRIHIESMSGLRAT